MINEYTLDEATRTYLSEINQKMQDAQMQAAQPFATMMQSALQLTIRLNKLEGSWKLSEDGSKLVRVDVAGPPQAEFTKKSARKKN